jgi:hypothetical protein
LKKQFPPAPPRAPFRDRVVHHALCAVIQPIFEAGFIAHSFANRKSKGTHRAIEVYEGYRNRHAYVLRCDILKPISGVGSLPKTHADRSPAPARGGLSKVSGSD